jgi:predicted dehydrogenase
MKQHSVSENSDRRTFLKTTALASAFSIVPSHVLAGHAATAPSDKLNIAGVGLAGMGNENLKKMEAENIVALCDVDWRIANKTIQKYSDAKRYKDFRIMLEKQKDIDAVLVATPDHTHAIISKTAMELGKHVYTQKPLTRTVGESRQLAELADKMGVCAQMGNQHHSGEEIRTICEWLDDGAIGPVHEVHVWTDRPVWPQNVPNRPELMQVPEHLDWNLWIGPSPYRPYNRIYHPFSWRGWWDFGTGALGDIGCHSIDFPYLALKLKYPTSVSASYSKLSDPKDGWKEIKNAESFPLASIVTYNFPARGEMPPVRLIWYDGGLMPPRPEELEPNRKMPIGGILYVGEKGKILNGEGSTRIIPEIAMQEYTLPAKTIPRIETSHEENWIECCKNGKPSSSNFAYAGPLSETVLLGNIALRFPGEQLEFDPHKLSIKNNTEASAFINTNYREGW